MILANVCLALAGCDDNSTNADGQHLQYETASRSTSPEKDDDAEQETSRKDSSPREETTSKPVPPNVVMDEEEESQASQLGDENSSASKSDQTCGTQSAQTAFQDSVSQVAPWYTIGWELIDSSGYDPCASLSWETLMIEGGTSSSPYHIMLFNHGEYLGTATAEPYGFAPTVERVNDSEIAVTYHWPRKGESNANRSGTTNAGFRWDESEQKVIMSGDVPPTR
ncbi:LppP/LprE family lipoprotein [Corynebacterium sp. KPL3927]|uniref:LppP/LprE family lipoprotein n=1 Tax=Corynebacterium sp. KPL3927 TaxID=3158324 RepID=UPI0032EE4195